MLYISYCNKIDSSSMTHHFTIKKIFKKKTKSDYNGFLFTTASIKMTESKPNATSAPR